MLTVCLLVAIARRRRGRGRPRLLSGGCALRSLAVLAAAVRLLRLLLAARRHRSRLGQRCNARTAGVSAGAAGIEMLRRTLVAQLRRLLLRLLHCERVQHRLVRHACRTGLRLLKSNTRLGGWRASKSALPARLGLRASSPRDCATFTHCTHTWHLRGTSAVAAVTCTCTPLRGPRHRCLCHARAYGRARLRGR